MSRRGGNDGPLPAHLACRVLVLGVGTRFFGDDGFGPRVVERLLAEGGLPEGVCLIDAGTGASRILFDVAVSERRPKLLVICDAVDLPNHSPGEVFEVAPSGLPANKRDDFSLHQLPGADLLADLTRGGCRVRIVACQVKHIPAEISEGLSPEVEAALSAGAALVRAILATLPRP